MWFTISPCCSRLLCPERNISEHHVCMRLVNRGCALEDCIATWNTISLHTNRSVNSIYNISPVIGANPQVTSCKIWCPSCWCATWFSYPGLSNAAGMLPIWIKKIINQFSHFLMYTKTSVLFLCEIASVFVRVQNTRRNVIYLQL